MDESRHLDHAPFFRIEAGGGTGRLALAGAIQSLFEIASSRSYHLIRVPHGGGQRSVLHDLGVTHRDTKLLGGLGDSVALDEAQPQKPRMPFWKGAKICSMRSALASNA